MSDIEQIASDLKQILNISDTEQTSTDTEQTFSDTDPMVTISDTEQVSTDTEEISSGTERATSDTEKATSDTEKATSDTEKATSDTENSLDLVVEDFCLEMYAFVFKEMKYIIPNEGYVINDSEPQISFSPQFILDVGKAVAYYALVYRDEILHILNLCKYVLLRRPETMEPFLKEFFERFCDSFDGLPRDKFLVGVLAYCAFICLMTDFFLTYTNTMDFAEKCYQNFKTTITSNFEKIQNFGGWTALQEIAEPYGRLYGCRLAEYKPKPDPNPE